MASLLNHLHTIWISPHQGTGDRWVTGEEYKRRLIWAYVGEYGIGAWFDLIECGVHIAVMRV